MYFFLTNHCKMQCAHCCANASPRGRHYRAENVFAAGVKLAEDLGKGVFLGGGEPTDHPAFLSFVTQILYSNVEMEGSGVITNGSNEREAIFLSRLSDVFYVALSRTRYHESWMVSDRVQCAFEDLEHRTGERICKQGRGKDISGATKGCACPGIWMNWNGDLYACGCKKKKYGNVITGYKIPDDANLCDCSEETD
jgi:hypothetical protein